MSKQLYVIDFSSLILSLHVMNKDGRRKIHHVMDSPIHGKHDSVSCNSVLHCVCKLQSFFVSTCNLFSQYLLYNSIFLLLLLCRAVTQKVVGVQGCNLATTCTQLSGL